MVIISQQTDFIFQKWNNESLIFQASFSSATVAIELRGKMAARVLTSDAIFDRDFISFIIYNVVSEVIGQIEAHSQEQLPVTSTKTRRTQTSKKEEI